MKTQTIHQANPTLMNELADKLQGLVHHDGYYTALCPYHDNRHTPAFFLYQDGFRCASCGEWGSLEKLAAKLNGTSIKYQTGPIERVVPEWDKWLKEYGSYRKAMQAAHKKAMDYPVLISYLAKRNLQQYVKFGKFGYIDGWLSFPVFDADGDFVDWVVRSTPNLETDVKYAIRPRKGKNDFHLYTADWDAVLQSKEIYLPFGILDMWTLHEMGLPTVTGLTGKTYQPEWFNFSRAKIWIIPDYNEEEDAQSLAQRIGWRAKVLQLPYPEDCKDCNDVYVKHGIGGLQKLI